MKRTTRNTCLAALAITATLAGCLVASPAFADVPVGTPPKSPTDVDSSTVGGPIMSTPEHKTIYEPYTPGGHPEDAGSSSNFRFPLPGMSRSEVGRYQSSGGKGKTTTKDVPGKKPATTRTTYTNPRAGLRDDPRPTTLKAFVEGSPDSYGQMPVRDTKDLAKFASVFPINQTDVNGVTSQTGIQFQFDPTVYSDQAELSRVIFAVSGGTFSSCEATGKTFNCTLASQHKLRKAPFSVLDLLPDLSDRQVPLCLGTVKDGGVGFQTVISLDDVDCDAAPGKEPVKLEVDTTYSAVDLGLPLARERDGSIVYTGNASSQGDYVSAKVYAVSADGTRSWPFYVVIRNRFAPTAALTATTPIETTRGVDTTIPATSIFADQDIDRYASESGDHLTSTVTTQGAMGGAWFDTTGNLHYQSIDVIHGTYTDHITVKTVDSFGLPSPDVTLSIHITDIAPGCATDGTTTDTNTPVRIHLTCWITPTEGWRQITGLDYRITTQPEHGTLTDFDPTTGTATYTPDAGHPGPVTIGFQADNNGATRDAHYAVNVLTEP